MTGVDSKGTKHTITMKVNYKVLDYGATKIEAFDTTGKTKENQNELMHFGQAGLIAGLPVFYLYTLIYNFINVNKPLIIQLYNIKNCTLE